MGSVANFPAGRAEPSGRHSYAARSAKVWKAVAPLAGICPLRIICAASIPEMVAAAEWNALKGIAKLFAVSVSFRRFV